MSWHYLQEQEEASWEGSSLAGAPMRKCSKCRREMTVDDFGNAKYWCRRCRTAGTKDWWARNRDAVNEQCRARYARQTVPSSTRYRRALRADVLRAYGSACACCGEARTEFLCVDHVGGGGTKQRRESGRSSIYAKLRRTGYPLGYRILCWNCNSSMGLYGYSPANRDFR